MSEIFDQKHRSAPVGLRCTVNGAPVECEVSPRTSLADFLRQDLGLTGTHQGCEHGVCGACLVLLGGEPVNSCLMLAAQAHGRDIRTIEDFSEPDGDLHEIQQALVRNHGLQCGFCTPGFVIRIAALIDENPAPTRQQVSDALAGNICRCTGYQGIVQAVLDLTANPPE